MEIKHREDGTHGAFYIDENNSPIAELTYSMTDANTMLISHTGVSPVLRGQGIAMKLVQAATEYARQNGIKVVPVCSYVRWAYDNNSGLRDVLKDTY
jgi:predicted GNAT family acetyltransferase